MSRAALAEILANLHEISANPESLWKRTTCDGAGLPPLWGLRLERPSISRGVGDQLMGILGRATWAGQGVQGGNL